MFHWKLCWGSYLKSVLLKTIIKKRATIKVIVLLYLFVSNQLYGILHTSRPFSCLPLLQFSINKCSKKQKLSAWMCYRTVIIKKNKLPIYWRAESIWIGFFSESNSVLIFSDNCIKLVGNVSYFFLLSHSAHLFLRMRM